MVEAAQLSETEYARYRKELLMLMSQLRAVGAQGELDLPRIVVIGNQSAGKSSVVEAISGIKVPRDAGTCTRCPMECRLSSTSGPWSCRISIRLEFNEDGSQRPDVQEYPFGDPIISKDEVEIALRRAQFAVLHPSVTFAEILELDVQDLRAKATELGSGLEFSRNVVCVDLEGSELTDLMFLDLPGIIQNAEPDTVKLVEDMVVTHIQGNCLILVALPMTDDIENQKALRLAHQQDPEGRRTIGVLTKPDMLVSASKARDLWLDVIEGRRHPLLHGYYCTKQPDDDERSKNMTNAQARRAEKTFFAATKPWSSSGEQKRFGTDNLVATLSTMLVQIINESLPHIREVAHASMENCRRDLARVPEKVVGEPATHMLNLVTEFCTEVGKYVEGQSDTSTLIHERNAAFKEFKKAIHDTQPKFKAQLLTASTEGAANHLITRQLEVNLADVRKHIEESITRELPGNIPFSAKKSLIVAFQDPWLGKTVECLNKVKHSMLALLILSAEQRFGRYNALLTRLKACITGIADDYYRTCGDFLIATLEMEHIPYTQNDHYLQSSTDKWYGRYKEERALNGNGKRTAAGEDVPDSAAHKKAKGPAAQSKDGAGSAPDPFKFAFTKTPATPFGVNGTSPFGGLPSVSAPAVPTPSVPAPLPSSSSTQHEVRGSLELLAMLSASGYPGLTEDDLSKLLPADEYETELKVMAEVRGYFQCAYKRVADNIPNMIDLKFLRAISSGLQQRLITEFELGSENAAAVCKGLLAEDPRVVARRDELSARRNRLEQVLIQLHNFGRSRG